LVLLGKQSASCLAFIPRQSGYSYGGGIPACQGKVTFHNYNKHHCYSDNGKPIFMIF
jgi:hypothetical protein